MRISRIVYFSGGVHGRRFKDVRPSGCFYFGLRECLIVQMSNNIGFESLPLNQLPAYTLINQTSWMCQHSPMSSFVVSHLIIWYDNFVLQLTHSVPRKMVYLDWSHTAIATWNAEMGHTRRKYVLMVWSSMTSWVISAMPVIIHRMWTVPVDQRGVSIGPTS